MNTVAHTSAYRFSPATFPTRAAVPPTYQVPLDDTFGPQLPAGRSFALADLAPVTAYADGRLYAVDLGAGVPVVRWVHPLPGGDRLELRTDDGRLDRVVPLAAVVEAGAVLGLFRAVD